jgi:hypothetical protein
MQEYNKELNSTTKKTSDTWRDWKRQTLNKHESYERRLLVDEKLKEVVQRCQYALHNFE